MIKWLHHTWITDVQGDMREVTDIASGMGDSYDFGARHYDPHLGTWMAPDPMAEKYPGMSPFVYCAGDPVNVVDPEGEDVWLLDKQGNFQSRITDKEKDAFYIVESYKNDNDYQVAKDDYGNDIVIELEYGTVINHWQRSYEGGVDDIYKVRGDDNGTELFEFFADNITGKSGVEFGLTETGFEGNQGLDFITSSHQVRKEGGFIRLFNTQLRFGYTIRRHTHSHRVSAFPSGLGKGKTTGDMAVLKDIVSSFEKTGRKPPVFSIYVKNSYIIYNRYSERSDFE